MRVGLLLIMLFLMKIVFAQEQLSVFFESNKHELTPKEEARLKDWINKNKASKIVAINGYTDEVGSATYNDSLAQKRVDFVFNYIKDKYPEYCNVASITITLNHGQCYGEK